MDNQILTNERLCETLCRAGYVSESFSIKPPSQGREKRQVSAGNTLLLLYLDYTGKVEDLCVRGDGTYNLTDPWSEIALRIAAENRVVFGQSTEYSDPRSYFVSPRTRITRSANPKDISGLNEDANLIEEINRVSAAQDKFEKLISAEIKRIMTR